MDCYCDYETPTVYVPTQRRAKKPHLCSECGTQILPGEIYEKVFGVQHGSVYAPKTCCRCLDLREWVKAHVPCFCWQHYSMIDDAIETARDYGGGKDMIGSGFLFGTYRRTVIIEKHRKAHPWKATSLQSSNE